MIPDSSPPLTLQIDDIVVGQGTPVSSGDFLIMNYVGVSYSNGLQFDASWDHLNVLLKEPLGSNCTLYSGTGLIICVREKR